MSPGATDFQVTTLWGREAKEQNALSTSLLCDFFPCWIYSGWQQQQRCKQRLQLVVPQQRKEALSFVIKSLPPGAWKYNSALTLIYFIALFAVFRFNYWLVLLQKANVLLYQLPGRDFSENYHILQREVIIFHFPWKILAQDTAEVCLMHCHRFTGNIKPSRASKLSTQYLAGVILISDTLNNLSKEGFLPL